MKFNMKCLLMNKNTKVALLEYNTESNKFTQIYQIYDIAYAPLSVSIAEKDKSKNILKELNNWFTGRGIPSWRKDIEKLLEKLNVTSPEELLDKAFALSLSDQYWIKEENDNIRWQDINFFTNDFEYKAYLNASLSSSDSHEQISLHSPNNTTDGMIQKAWVIENGKRKLIKGTYEFTRQEPINEWLGANICKRLGFDYCDYEIDVIGNQIVSKCEDFINDNEEIITANDIFMLEKKPNNISDYEHYINILEKNNVPNARKNIENMFILDFIIMNIDRHMKNYGIIRNVETLEWERVTPIFDNGQSMQANKLKGDINFVDGKGKFFRSLEGKKFSDYMENINNLTRIDITKLNGLTEEYREVLKKYKYYTDMSDERIEIQVNGLETRINQLNQSIQKSSRKM